VQVFAALTRLRLEVWAAASAAPQLIGLGIDKWVYNSACCQLHLFRGIFEDSKYRQETRRVAPWIDLLGST
jgi:hypothetical protein